MLCGPARHLECWTLENRFEQRFFSMGDDGLDVEGMRVRNDDARFLARNEDGGCERREWDLMIVAWGSMR